MRTAIKKIVNNFFNLFGFELIRLKPAEAGPEKNSLLYHFYNNLKQIDFEPRHIVDIGANHGSWTREALGHFPNAYYTLLEPQYWLKESITDILENNNKVKFNAVGAGATNGTFNFTIVDRDDSCSFRYSEAEAEAEGLKQIKLPVVTLNEFLKESGLPTPDIIKIDAEGLDLEVLAGASDYLGKTEIFIVEVGIVNKIFDNSILKMINYMDDKGYVLFDITDINRPFLPAVLWLAELVFVKRDGVIDSKIYI